MATKNALIITYYDAPNYGAFLQTYATQEFLKSHGIDAHILEHKANKPGLINALLDKQTELEVLEYRNRIQSEINQVQQYLNMGRYGESYDVAVIGSDEIWNVKNLTARHLTVFFKPYKWAKKTVAYAACAGSCQTKHMKLFPYTKGIKQLDAVAVRDEYTENLAHDMGVPDVRRTLDPTFLHDFRGDIPARAISEEYVLVYTYGLSEDSIKAVQTFARTHQLKIVATGSNCDWADLNPIVSPFEWLSLIQHSAYVVTSTFHGSVFSVILNKSFAVLNTDSNKINSLLTELQLMKRKANCPNDLENILGAKMNYREVNRVVDRLRKESAEYLLDNF